MTDSDLRVPRWAEYTTFLLSLIGLGLSIYLSYTHLHPGALVCSTSGVINCAKVTTSAESHVLGIPVAYLGVANYVVMTAINSPLAWRSPWRWLHVARFALVVLAMCFVLWLVFAEVIIIGNICEYCTMVHLTTFALLLVLTRVSPYQLGWASRAR